MVKIRQKVVEIRRDRDKIVLRGRICLELARACKMSLGILH